MKGGKTREMDNNDDSNHEQEITSLQELSFGVLPYTSRNVLVKRFFNFQTEE